MYVNKKARRFVHMGGIILVLSAAAALANVDIKVSGTVVANASCTFSSAIPLQVEYSDVYIDDINTRVYSRALNYTLVCKGDAAGKKVTLQLKGSEANFDTSLLKTSVNGLGIRLLNNDTTQKINDWFIIDPNNQPRLKAELVKQSGASFRSGQEFNAAATLVVVYQ